jgi:glycosyltransferase involved in cell wall biosynthesis
MYFTYEEISHKESFSDTVDMPIITFIIPSIGRPTLPKTLDSLKKMADPHWQAIVMFDGIAPTIQSDDPRITVLRMEKTGTLNHAGRVRNEAIRHATTEWIGFVDDDDTLNPSYVTDLRAHLVDNPDVVIFRMQDKHLIIPPPDHTDFIINHVGISFCAKRSLFVQDQIWFEPSGTEDFYLLNAFRAQKKRIIMSPRINYNVRG